MSVNAPVAFAQKYTTMVQLLLQQRGSRFRDAVTVQSITGAKAAKAMEQIGAVNPVKNQARHSDTPLVSTPHDARWMYPNDYDWADLIDEQDMLRMVADFKSPYVVNGTYAMGRAQDDEIVTALFASAATGENGGTPVPFPSAQQVLVTEGATGNTGMNIAKLRAAKKLLLEAEVDLDNDPLFCAISAKQHNDLLNEAQAINLDYTDKPVLVEGRIRSFMGFQFINSERLPVNGSSQRRCPVWAKSGVALGVWNDIQTSLDRRPDKRNSWQVYVTGTFGATRLEEKKVVEIPCV